MVAIDLELVAPTAEGNGSDVSNGGLPVGDQRTRTSKSVPTAATPEPAPPDTVPSKAAPMARPGSTTSVPITPASVNGVNVGLPPQTTAKPPGVGWTPCSVLDVEPTMSIGPASFAPLAETRTREISADSRRNAMACTPAFTANAISFRAIGALLS